MTPLLSRRAFLAGLSLPSTLTRIPAAPSSSAIKIGMVMRDLSEANLRFFRQIGVEWAAVVSPQTLASPPTGAVPPAGRPPAGSSKPWTEAQLQQIKQRVESAGLRLGHMMLHPFPNVILGTPASDNDIESVCESIRVAARVGIPVLEYNFYGLRASEGYFQVEGRGGARYTAFDYQRVRNQPPLPELGEQSEAALWERLTRFVKAVVPVAAKAGVRLALHPNDPPVPGFRGVAQPVGSIEGMKRLVEIVRSPANGITLDTGVFTEMGGNAVDLIRWFGRRDCINHVHFRNVRVDVPRLKYTETFIDEGQADMLAAMRAFRDVGYSHMIVPDHTPQISGDSEGRSAGWAYAIGYIRGLLRAAEAGG